MTGFQVITPRGGQSVRVDIDELTPAELEGYAAAHPAQGVPWALLLAGWIVQDRHPPGAYAAMAVEAQETVQGLEDHPEEGWALVARLCGEIQGRGRRRDGEHG